jgi:hypothetical protein
MSNKKWLQKCGGEMSWKGVTFEDRNEMRIKLKMDIRKIGREGLK